MPLIPQGKLNNSLKGPYTPARYRCEGFDDGVPFVRVYRTMRGVTALSKKQNITRFSYIILN